MKRSRPAARRPAQHVFLTSVTQKKTSMVWRGRMIWTGCCAAALIALGLLVHVGTRSFLEHAFYRNPDFAIRTIEVEITGNVARSEILEWSGVQPGMNLMQLNLADVRSRLRRMPSIAEVVVERELPSTLRITVEERQPVARLVPYSTAGNQLALATYYVDERGYVIKPKAGERIKPLPVIRGIPHEHIREGERTERAELISALNLLRAADYSALKGELDLTEIEIQGRGCLRIRTRDQGLIIFRADYMQEQIQRLRVILDYARDQQKFVRTVDLTPERNVPVTFF